MTRRTLAVVTAGLSQPSATRLLADQLAAATQRRLDGQGVELQIQVAELRDHAHDVVNNLLTGFPSTGLRTVLDAVRQADGLVVVTPIFNASYGGLLKIFCDVLEDGSLAGKPVLVAATGGTPRHSLALEHALRPLFVHLHAVVVPTAVFAAAEDWGSDGHQGGTRGSALAARIDRAANELGDLMYSRMLMYDAAADSPPDPYDDPIPFDSLLAAHKPEH
jgi:FMN reductase